MCFSLSLSLSVSWLEQMKYKQKPATTTTMTIFIDSRCKNEKLFKEKKLIYLSSKWNKTVNAN